MPTCSSLTPEQKTAVLERYRLDPSPVRIASALGLTTEVVKGYVKKTGEYQPRRLVTEDERQEMVRRYAGGESSWDIAAAMGYLNVCVIKNLNRAGVTLRNRSTAAKVYSVDQDYFRQIDTPAKAYILGLVWSDGNVYKDSFTLALKAVDKYLLEWVAAELGSTGPLNFRKRQRETMSDMWALRVHDQRFCDGLRQLGVVERKTSKLRFPTFLPRNLWRPFILGILDGDGCICLCAGSIHVNIAGADNMLLDLQRLFKDEVGIHLTFRRKEDSKGCTLTCSATVALRLLNWLYAAQLPQIMRRKYDRYTTFVQTFKGKRPSAATLKQIALAKTIVAHHAAP